MSLMYHAFRVCLEDLMLCKECTQIYKSQWWMLHKNRSVDSCDRNWKYTTPQTQRTTLHIYYTTKFDLHSTKPHHTRAQQNTKSHGTLHYAADNSIQYHSTLDYTADNSIPYHSTLQYATTPHIPNWTMKFPVHEFAHQAGWLYFFLMSVMILLFYLFQIQQLQNNPFAALLGQGK